MSDTLFLINNYVRRLSVLSTTAVQRDGPTVALGVHIVVDHPPTTHVNEIRRQAVFWRRASGRSKLTDASVKFQFQTVPNHHFSPKLHRSKILQIFNPNYNIEPLLPDEFPKEQPSRELQFHPFSITREAPTTDVRWKFIFFWPVWEFFEYS